MAAPACCPIRLRRYCAVSRNFWAPFVLPLSTALFTFVSCGYFAAIRLASSFVSSLWESAGDARRVTCFQQPASNPERS
jgi:hypothetical protein